MPEGTWDEEIKQGGRNKCPGLGEVLGRRLLMSFPFTEAQGN